MGAAIVYAIRERRYLLLMGTYILCIFLHGLWNGLAVLFAFSGVAGSYVQQNLLNGLATVFAVALGLLAGLMLLLLILSNRRRRNALRSNPSLEETVP